ncbi:MAG: class II aldolase/adducin family protein [Pseudomonadota bacterium]
MSKITSRITGNEYDAAEWSLRVDMAAVFRLTVEFGWHESVANHFSATLSEDGKLFLLNPKWQHFSTIRASDLLTLNAEDSGVMERDNPPDPSAWCIHGAVHAAVPDAKVILHCHPTYATALCGLEDPRILPIDQNTARFFNRHVVDTEFGGLATEDEEGERIASRIAGQEVLIMSNHGITVVGQTVAQAFENLYYLERAAQTMLIAYQSGQPLKVMSDEIAEKTAQGWESFSGAGDAHFAHWKGILDQREPDYAS